MNDDRRNQTSEITAAERAEIRKELSAMTDEDVFHDIERSKSMRRHPFATNQDAGFFLARIKLARAELTKRMRKELDAL